jgi:hypothetical protein
VRTVEMCLSGGEWRGCRVLCQAVCV